MQSLFKWVRRSENEKVKEAIRKKPQLINDVSKGLPKKDDGQSLLEVAIKISNLEIANFLIDSGADINFMETEGVNEWKLPVIQIAIGAAIFNAINSDLYFNGSFSILKKLIAKNVNLKVSDSYGNNCAMRAALTARQITIHLKNNEIIEQRVNEVFKLLKNSGVNFKETTPTRRSPVEQFKNDYISKFF